MEYTRLLARSSRGLAMSPPVVTSSHRGASQLVLVRPPEDWPVQKRQCYCAGASAVEVCPHPTSEAVSLACWTSSGQTCGTRRPCIVLIPLKCVFRQLRREVTHKELFQTVKSLLAAARNLFDRYNREPSRTFSVIGSHAQNII